jgi:ferredoxin--NADP+ reductase
MTGLASVPAVLLEREEVSPRLGLFRIGAAAAGAPLPPFEAGQHLAVSMEGEDGRWLSRPISVASPPEERERIEFCVSRSGRGADRFVERLWALSPGDALRLGAGGEGRLTLRATVGEADGRFLLLVAAGTGIAPFASLVRGWAARGDEARLGRAALLHGASSARDLVWADFFRAALGEARYRPTVSREGERDGWTGERGRVESLLAPDRIEATERALGLAPGSIVPRGAAVFVCGFPETVSAVESSLAARGYARGAGSLFTEG